MRKPLLIALGVIGIAAILIYARHTRLQAAIARADAEFLSFVPPKLARIGSVRNLTLTPLVEWHADSPDFRTEAGVSYLIQADDKTLLFDLGYNAKDEDPSPLQHNMAKLGVGMDSVEIIVLSHHHFDHVGGKKWMDAKSFSPGLSQPALGAKRIFTPIDMTYPGQDPVTSREPRILDSGIATLGTIPAELIIGRTDEQTLAIHVEGKGLVLVVGCSHPSLSKILKRAQDVFDEPIYGIIGGLHFPLPEGRLKFAGGLLDAQRLGSGNGPFDQLTREDVDADIRRLKALGIQLIGVGGHDSSDEIIDLFKREFGSAWRPVKVGHPIRIASDPG